MGTKSQGADAPNQVNTVEADRFDEVLVLIHSARQRAVQAVNTQLIDLYWQVGAYISHKLQSAEWGAGVVSQLADHLAQTQPGLRGFTRANLFRMRQFYEVYRGDEIVAPLVRQLPWSHNMMVLGQCKRPEERAFYLRMAVQEKWSRRELERQLKGALFAEYQTQLPDKALLQAKLQAFYALDAARTASM
jgi:predicted nuclease of restriction endonuclease-like (RecB) superfamily